MFTFIDIFFIQEQRGGHREDEQNKYRAGSQQKKSEKVQRRVSFVFNYGVSRIYNEIYIFNLIVS